MQAIFRRQDLIGIEVVPAFTLDVPDHIKALLTPRFGLQQILLKRGDPGGGMHFVLCGLPVHFGHCDKVFAVAGAEPGHGLAVVKFGVVEIAQHGLRGGQGPRQRVLRAFPQVGLIGVAIGTGV